MNVLQAIGASKKYTKESVDGIGSVAGAPCTIKSVVKTANKNVVTFEWTSNSGVKQTSTMDVLDGAGIKSIAIDGTTNHVMVTLEDNTVIDGGEMPKEPVKISADSGNAVSMKADGLYVSSTGVQISAKSGNIIKTEADGLYAKADEVKKSAKTDNVLTIETDGLYVPKPDSQIQADFSQTDNTKADFIKNKPVVDSAISSTSTNAIENKAVKTELDKKVDIAQGVANKGKSLIVGTDGNVTLGNAQIDIATSFGATPSDTKVPSEKLVKDSLDTKADKTVENTIADNWNGNGYNLIPFPYADKNAVTRGGVTFTVKENGTVKANGTSTGGAWLYLWNYQQGLLIEKGKTYVISDGIDNSDYRMELAFYKNGSSVGTSILDNGNGTKFTAPNDDTYDSVRLALWVRTGTTATDVVYKPMLVEVNADGTYPTEYQRYSKGNVELAKYLDEQVERGYLRNKNLVDGVLNAIIDSSGNITSGSGDKTTVIFYALANTKYTVSGSNRDRSRVSRFTEKPTIGSTGTIVIDSDRTTTFIAPVDGWYAWYMSSTSDSAPQVEKGSSATSYVEPNGKSNVELTDEIAQKEREITDLKMLGWTVPSDFEIQNYTDSNGVFHQRVGRVDLGSLTWVVNSQNNFYSTEISDINTHTSTENYIYCSKYEYNSKAFGGSATTNCICQNSKRIWIIDSNYTDATAFKSAMSGVYLYYELTTEVTKSVDGNEKVEELTTKELTFSATVFEDNSKIKVHRVGNVVQVSFFGAKTNAKISKYGILVTNIPKSLSYVGHYIDCGSTSSSIYMNGDTTRIQSNAEINIGDELWGSLVYISK